MNYRRLGRTGLRVSELGVGGLAASGKLGRVAADGTAAEPDGEPDKWYRNIPMYDVAKDGFAQILARASELGVNFLDTAPSYGDSESVFGHYLADPGNRRHWIVCTKVGVCGSWGSGETMPRQAVVDQCEQSLRRLRVDAVDILLIHSIDQYGKGEQAANNLLQPGGMVDTLRELKAAGKIRFFGASGQLPELVPAARTGAFDVILTYNTYNLLVADAFAELFPAARAMDLGVILGGAFYQGLLTGNRDFVVRNRDIWFEKEDPGHAHTEQMLARVRRLLEFVNGDGRALRSLATRFALTAPEVSTVVAGMKSVQELEENASACEQGPIADKERADLDKLLAAAPAPSWSRT